MGERAQLLAKHFEQMNGELIAAVEQCTEADWQALCLAEGWSVGVTAHHIADATPLLWHLAQGLADGTPLPPVTVEMNRQQTAQHAIANADCTRDETAILLRHSGANVAQAIRQLSDEQLAQASSWTFGGGETVTVRQFIEQYMTDHIRDHLASMKRAIGTGQ